MLGGEQSGHVDAVGFEMYTSMLEKTIRELRGQEMPEEVEAQLNLGIDIRIPADYIREENHRLRMYKRVAGVESEQELSDVQAEMEDRYGPLPPAVRSLAEYAALRLVARRIGVAAIDRKREHVAIRFLQNAKVDPQKLARFVASNGGAQFTPNGMLKYQLRDTAPDQVLARLRDILGQLASEQMQPAD
jgi:transcription-repair coupling factor (superfamily II helicase)